MLLKATKYNHETASFVERMQPLSNSSYYLSLQKLEMHPANYSRINNSYIYRDLTSKKNVKMPANLDGRTKNELAAPVVSAAGKKKTPGQVFTPLPLAKFMISLIKHQLTNKHRVLDPCIGPNTFFSLFDEMDCHPNLTGIEVDAALITDEITAFYNKPHRRLLLHSFLQHPLKEQYDFIIQNPPYVRQELLGGPHNTKQLALQNISPEIASLIPTKSNLYVYFLVKAILHLKENGVMVAVMYDSWLYSAFGKALKKILLQLGIIESIYHFKENAFEYVDVGATVIYFKKGSNTAENEKGLIKYYPLNAATGISATGGIANVTPVNISFTQFENFNFNNAPVINFSSHFFVPLKSISNQRIQRGTSSVVNSYFLHNTKRFTEAVPLIKDVLKIKQFAATAPTCYLLAVNGSIAKQTKAYLATVKSSIVSAGDKYKAVIRKMVKKEQWYKVTLKKPRNFIFNYYLRNNPDFILNEQLLHISDNFYVLNIPHNPLAHLAILNSSFSKTAILIHSRSQGNGLQKIQLYEFKDVPIININALSANAVKRLEKLGDTMRSADRYSNAKTTFIQNIDSILISEYNRYTGADITLMDLST